MCFVSNTFEEDSTKRGVQTTLSATTPAGTKVVGWLHRAKSDTVILLLPAHNMDAARPRYIELAKALHARRYACFRMNFTRKSAGEDAWEVLTVSEEAEQAAAVVNLLKTKFKRVIAVGHSQGWLSALKLAHDGLVDAAVCLMGVIDTSANVKSKLAQLGVGFEQLEAEGYAVMEAGDKRFYYTPEFFSDTQGWNVASMLKEVHAPLLFVFGTNDDIITPSEITKAYELANEPKELVGVDCWHRFEPQDAVTIGDKIAKWVRFV